MDENNLNPTNTKPEDQSFSLDNTESQPVQNDTEAIFASQDEQNPAFEATPTETPGNLSEGSEAEEIIAPATEVESVMESPIQNNVTEIPAETANTEIFSEPSPEMTMEENVVENYVEPVSMPDEPLEVATNSEDMSEPEEMAPMEMPTMEPAPVEMQAMESAPMEMPTVENPENVSSENLAFTPEPAAQNVEAVANNEDLAASPEITVTPDETSSFEMQGSNLEAQPVVQADTQVNNVVAEQLPAENDAFPVDAPQATPPSAQNHGGHKGLISGILIVLLLALIGYGSYVFFFKGQTQAEDGEQEVSEEVNRLEEAISEESSSGIDVPESLMQLDEGIGSQEEYNQAIDGLFEMVVGQEAMNQAAEEAASVRRR